MYLRGTTRRTLGQDYATELAATLTEPIPVLGGLSPLWAAGLGLFALAFILSAGGKQVRKVKKALRKRRLKKERIDSLKQEIRSLN